VFPSSIALNVGEVRNTSTELEASARPVETAALSWSVGGSYSKTDNMVVRLDPRTRALMAGADVTSERIAVGYPLFGRWAKPILGYADANGDGVIQPREI